MWSKNTTTNVLRHLRIRENAIRDSSKIIEIEHVAGKINPADMFTKEDKDEAHFIQLRDTIVTDPLSHNIIQAKTAKISQKLGNTTYYSPDAFIMYDFHFPTTSYSTRASSDNHDII